MKLDSGLGIRDEHLSFSPTPMPAGSDGARTTTRARATTRLLDAAALVDVFSPRQPPRQVRLFEVESLSLGDVGAARPLRLRQRPLGAFDYSPQLSSAMKLASTDAMTASSSVVSWPILSENLLRNARLIDSSNGPIFSSSHDGEGESDTETTLT